MPDAEIIQMPSPSDANYERERAALVGNSPSQAGVYWGQAMARLIYQYSCVPPGWTVRDLAEKEKELGNKGASPTYIGNKIIFGEFLSAISGQGVEPNWLSGVAEMKFRTNWFKTKGLPTKEARFREVARMLQEPPPEKKLDNRKLLAEFGDGKWHRVETVADCLAQPADKVLAHIKKRHWYGGSVAAQAEVKQVGKSHQVRIFHSEKTVNSAELNEKLRPLVDGIMAEGRKSQIRISTAALLGIAGQLQQLLDEWS